MQICKQRHYYPVVYSDRLSMPTRFSQFVILIYCYIECVRCPNEKKAFSSFLVTYAFENNYKRNKK